METVGDELLCSASNRFSRGLCVLISVASAHPTRAGPHALRVIYIIISYAFPTLATKDCLSLLTYNRRNIDTYATAYSTKMTTLDNVPAELIIQIA